MAISFSILFATFKVVFHKIYFQSVVPTGDRSVSSTNGSTLVAPISGHSPGLVRAQVSHGVRQVSLYFILRLRMLLNLNVEN